MTMQICDKCGRMYAYGNCYNCASNEADHYVPDGCIAIGNEHGACMDRGCMWCFVYYDGAAMYLEDCTCPHFKVGCPAEIHRGPEDCPF